MNTMAAISAKPRAFLAIAVGGAIVGTFDLTAAYIMYGPRVPRGIARGLVGSIAYTGGVGMYALGIFLHYFIAISAAAIYYAASRRLTFLKEHPLVCGMYYGIAIFLVMNLIVLPLSAIHARGPFTLRGLIQGLLVHMILIGVPIAYSVRAYSGEAS